MTEPGLTPEERAVRVSDLRQQADDAMAHLHARVAAVKTAQEKALSTSGEAKSRDGGVRVVVDATGVVTKVEFASTVFAKNTPEKLAQTVVATVQAAAAKARGQLAEAWAPVRGENPGTLATVRESAASFGINIGVPEVPRTAIDPTARDQWSTGSQPPPQEDRWAPPVDEPPTAPPMTMAPPVATRRPAPEESSEIIYEERPW